MKKRFLQTFGLTLLSFVVFGQASDLFISEYAEGSSNNKYMEIFNGTGSTVDLHNYFILQNSNGGPVDEYLDTLSGMLANNDVYVIANASADASILAVADLTGSGICYFNGNDARALAKVVTDGSQTDTISFDYDGDGTPEDVYVKVLDLIGSFPTNPGSGWAVAGVADATKDHTLIRKSSVDGPQSCWTCSAGTDSLTSEWLVYPKNYWTGVGSHTFIPPGPGIPTYPISTLTTEDADGVADSLDVSCRITGVVVSVNYRAYKPGLQFVVHDGTAGIWVYNYSGTKGYDVFARGDKIEVYGKVSQYKGLTQFAPDSINVLSSGNTEQAATVVTMLDESKEGEVVTLENVMLIDPAQWTAGSYGRNIDVSNGNDTFTLRVETESDLHGMAAPAGQFDISGVVGQYDASSPYLDGYQLFPRDSSDLYEHPVVYAPLVINEVLAKGSSTNGWVEIYNPSSDPVSLSGWALSDSKIDSTKWMFPDTTIDGKDYLLVWDANETGDLHCSFSFNAAGGDVVLTNPGAIADYITYKASGADTSWARIPNATGGLKMAVPTPAAENEEILPMYTISQILSTNPTTGFPDSLNVKCWIKGVVYGINYRAYKPGLNFVLHDGVRGIWIYHYSGTLDYNFRQGDELMMRGKVSFYNGLTEFDPDKIVLTDSNQTLMAPTVVTQLIEDNEGELVKLEKVWVADTSQWPKPTDYSVNVDVTNGVDTFQMRIVTDCNVHGTAPRLDTFLLTGLVGQYDSKFPFDEGYQVFPRDTNDLVHFDITSIREIEGLNFVVYPNPNNGTFTILNPGNKEYDINVVNALGENLVTQHSSGIRVVIDLGNQKRGIYFVRISSEGQTQLTKVLVR